MSTRHKVFIGLAAFIACFVAVNVGAWASGRMVEGNVRSFVINIAQAVPVEITAPIELDSGETVTVTAPVTVNVELRVSVDGKGVATAVKSAVQDPTVAVVETESSVLTDTLEIRNLAWRVAKQENLGSTLEWNTISFTTTGDYILMGFEIENLGNKQAELLQRDDSVDSLLIDERGREFSEMDYKYQFNETCRYIKVNPGLSVPCVMVFDVPKDVKSLKLRLSKDGDVVEIPLTVR